jgi:hypothetical protein
MNGVGINSGQWVPLGPNEGTRVGFEEAARGSTSREASNVKILILMTLEFAFQTELGVGTDRSGNARGVGWAQDHGIASVGMTETLPEIPPKATLPDKTMKGWLLTKFEISDIF